MISLFEFMKLVEHPIVAVGVTNRKNVVSEIFFQPFVEIVRGVFSCSPIGCV